MVDVSVESLQMVGNWSMTVTKLYFLIGLMVIPFKTGVTFFVDEVL